MSRLTLTNPTRLLRMMHTSGRQVPYPGQAGSPQVGTTSPSLHQHHPLPPVHPQPSVSEAGAESLIAHSAPDSSASGSGSSGSRASSSTASTGSPSFPGLPLKYTPKGKPIPVRPARTTKINLPSGYPEPDSFPVSAEYISSLASVTDPKPHPLWQFFHVPKSAMAAPKEGQEGWRDGLGALEVVDDASGNSTINSGRSWSAAELRQLSFADLHTLWYVLLKERNVQATQKEERRRMGVLQRDGGELLTKRAFRCRKSMARIKYVLNERRLALIASANASSNGITNQAQPQPSFPFSSSGASDPALQLEALRGESALPAWVYAKGADKLAEGLEEEGLFEDEDADADAEQRAVADEEAPVVAEEQVGKEEVESRDEGFGGGQEAKEFVRDVEVKDGHVQKK